LDAIPFSVPGFADWTVILSYLGQDDRFSMVRQDGGELAICFLSNLAATSRAADLPETPGVAPLRIGSRIARKSK
jgi:hypothetical protein